MPAFTSTILITGGTTGLGYWAAYHLACSFPASKIIISSRKDTKNAADSLNKLIQKHKGSVSSEPPVEFISVDLSSTANVRQYVTKYAQKNYPPINSLLLNAGLQFHIGKDIHCSPDGVESTFAINHVGHALLLFLLKPHLSPDARIVITASGTHDSAQKTMIPAAVFETAELLAHPTDKDGYETKLKGGQRYASSKLANVLFTYALEKRLKKGRDAGSHNWTTAAFDPGLMLDTNLGRDAPVPAFVLWILQNTIGKMLWLVRILVGSPNVHKSIDSGKSLADLAAKRGPAGVPSSGTYWEGAKEIPSSKDSHDEVKQEDLWSWTVNFLSKDDKEQVAFETFQRAV